MEFKDLHGKLYDALFEEYSHSCSFKYGSWSIFLNNKNIGLKYVKGGFYTIVDERKWSFTRLKYGI